MRRGGWQLVSTLLRRETVGATGSFKQLELELHGCNRRPSICLKHIYPIVNLESALLPALRVVGQFEMARGSIRSGVVSQKVADGQAMPATRNSLGKWIQAIINYT